MPTCSVKMSFQPMVYMHGRHMHGSYRFYNTSEGELWRLVAVGLGGSQLNLIYAWLDPFNDTCSIIIISLGMKMLTPVEAIENNENSHPCSWKK